MRTMATIRAEKNLIDAKKDFAKKKKTELYNQRIDFYTSKIKEEKQNIKDCLELNLFDMVQTKLNRILYLEKRIIQFNKKIN